ncbi:MAG: MaoC/PaaZ C-terminal domain-containing protein [Betaproteobacteria bacterium]|nr:MaoC/PaaZ C-terminal domain-containing protein [Betaproteobacteria bacterium]
MPINHDKLINWDIPEVEQRLTKRDVMLYALGVGLGAEPANPEQLKFVYEDNLQALPTMAVILGYPGPWHAHPDLGITRSHVVHGEQGFMIHRPLPVEGAVLGKTRVVDVVDKGKSKGALILTECKVRDKASGETICTLTSTTFCRADGGFGGAAGSAKNPHEIPDTEPQHTCDLPTLPQAALIYRLSGDYNPLHADPASAKQAGYKMPILHGRCIFGVVGHALLKTCCGYDPSRLKSMDARFSAPVFPGETIRTEMWISKNTVSFRATVPDRGLTVLDNGRATIGQ